MKKNITCFLFIIFISIMFITTEVKASDDNNVDVIANITSESQTVEQNKSVFVEMNIENIENVKSITGYIASTTDSNKYITVELKNTTQGSWYYFDLPSTVDVGETYTIPMIEVLYKDGTKITGKATGEFKIITKKEEEILGTITEQSQTVEQNKSVFVEMNIENIENVKSITGYIASTTDSNKYITVEFKSTTQGNWYYFDLPSTVDVGETYTIPKIEVLYKDGTKMTGKVSGQITVIKGSESSNNDNTIAKNILPKTGKEIIMKTVFLLGMILIILFIKNRKYKDII